MKKTRAEDLIRERIEKEGPITFRDFMEIALYHPEAGYYSSHRKRIGRSGDYYTSVSLGPLFGRMLAKQIAEMAEILGGDVTIVEMGAGSLDLAKDISSELKKLGVSFRYLAVDRCAAEKTLGTIEVKSNLSGIGPLKGVFLSNELVDAFPVHVVEKRGGRLLEVYVDVRDDGFQEVLSDPSTPDIKWYFDYLGVDLPEGYRTEVNLDAVSWLKEVSSSLERGFVITIDYGYPSNVLYSPERRCGTLLCYRENQVDSNPLEMVGEKDITSHVNFSMLAKLGCELSLDLIGFTTQAYFLMGLGILEGLEDMDVEERLKVKSLILPGGMGDIFKVLIQAKGVKGSFDLSGLKMVPTSREFKLP